MLVSLRCQIENIANPRLPCMISNEVKLHYLSFPGLPEYVRAVASAVIMKPSGLSRFPASYLAEDLLCYGWDRCCTEHTTAPTHPVEPFQS